MIYPRRMTRRTRAASGIAGLGLAGVMLVFANDAAADERIECAKAYEQAQRLQQRSELVNAFDAAERCARPSCPALLRDECVQWTTSIKQKTPQIVARVKASDGCMRSDAKIEAAGYRRREGETLFVDPGVHEITITDPTTGRTKTETIDFAQGERRDIDVDFAPANAACEPNGSPTPVSRHVKSRPIPTVTWVLGGIGAGLVLGGATLGLIGASKRSDLEACKGACTSDQIDETKTFFIAGDVLAGFGILALGVAAVTFFTRDEARAP
jgi:hypothetical protein